MNVTTSSTELSTEIPTKPGQEIHASALGTMDGATVTFYTFVDGAWRAVPDGVFTAPFEVVRTNGKGTLARLTVTNVGAATNLSINLTSIP